MAFIQKINPFTKIALHISLYYLDILRLNILITFPELFPVSPTSLYRHHLNSLIFPLQVWEGKYNDTLAVAVKQLKPGNMSRDQFLKEAAVMKNMKHEK